jgi:hypothetical protein
VLVQLPIVEVDTGMILDADSISEFHAQRLFQSAASVPAESISFPLGSRFATANGLLTMDKLTNLHSIPRIPLQVGLKPLGAARVVFPRVIEVILHLLGADAGVVGHE